MNLKPEMDTLELIGIMNSPALKNNIEKHLEEIKNKSLVNIETILRQLWSSKNSYDKLGFLYGEMPAE